MGCVDVYNSEGPVVQIYSCGKGKCNQQFVFNKTLFHDTCGKEKCIAISDQDPRDGTDLQIWAKPLPKGAMAVFVLNSYVTQPYQVEISLALLNMTGSVSVRDIWLRKNLGSVSA